MSVPTASDWLALVDAIAPFSLAEADDNVGLLIGDPAAQAQRVLLALDVSPAVACEAVDGGYQLLITHHPVLHHGTRTLRWDDSALFPALTLLRGHVAHIAAHTNLDMADSGVSDTLAARLSLECIEKRGYLRVGTLPCMPLCDLLDHVQKRLGGWPRLFGKATQRVSRIAVCPGAGADEAANARAARADVLITGDVRHHVALEAGLPLIDAGHWETERPIVDVLSQRLQAAANALNYSFNMDTSRHDASPLGASLGRIGGEATWI